MEVKIKAIEYKRNETVINTVDKLRLGELIVEPNGNSAKIGYELGEENGNVNFSKEEVQEFDQMDFSKGELIDLILLKLELEYPEVTENPAEEIRE